MGRKEQQNEEREIFKLFATLPKYKGWIDEATIQNRTEPEPDILCVDRHGDHLAFELVEIIDESVLSRFGSKKKLEPYLRDHLADIQNLSDANIVFIFQDNVSDNKKRGIIAAVRELLSTVAGDFTGDVTLPLPLKGILRDIVIASRGGQELMIGVSDFGSLGDPLYERVLDKFRKSYTSPAKQIGLLAYYRIPSFHAWTGKIEQIRGALAMHMAKGPCPFCRVWVFDITSMTVIAEIP